MRIRITALPAPLEVEGFNLQPYVVGHVYDVDTRMGELLIAMGFAILEMRSAERPDHTSRPR